MNTKGQNFSDQFKLCIGGDGTLLETIAKYNYEDLYYVPIRNGKRCPKHDNTSAVIPLKLITVPEFLNEHTTLSEVLTCHFGNKKRYCVSEFVLRPADPTVCLRVNIAINDKFVYQNAICDGIIVCTDVIGSHAYFHSITRTVFNEGIGFAFINPTYSLSNCVLSKYDTVCLEITRPMDVILVNDKTTTLIPEKEFIQPKNRTFKFSWENQKKIKLIDYFDGFMCFECRKLRNSTVQFNNFYFR